MKKYLLFFFNFFTIILSILIPPSFIKKIRRLFNHCYSVWYERQFKIIGENFKISYPFFLEGGKFIKIGNNFTAGEGIRLEAFRKHRNSTFSPLIEIGNNVSFYSDCHIGAINCITIGDNVLIASKVFITDHFHGDVTSKDIQLAPFERQLYSRGPIKIEKNVWIGEGVVILPGVTIGENCIIGANAVVTKTFPKNSVIGGNPAKILKTL
jgi:acetyltransferase-like isoleucine patch superfamily enzyme